MWWSQTNPRKRLGLEAFRMLVYVGLPVGAVAIYSTPSVMQAVLNHYKFIEYPPEGPKPPTNKEIWAMIRAEDKRRAQATEAGGQGSQQPRLEAEIARPDIERGAGVSTPSASQDGGPEKAGWLSWWRRG